jgi:hypothetical protein
MAPLAHWLLNISVFSGCMAVAYAHARCENRWERIIQQRKREPILVKVWFCVVC